MALSIYLTKWACFNDVFKDWPLWNLFSQWVCFNGIQFLTPFPSSIHLVSTEHLHCWKYELWSEFAVSCEHWGNGMQGMARACIRLEWNAKHWCEWLRAESVFKQWACFNDVVKVNLFDECVQHSESASMTYCCQSQSLYWASWQNELSSSEPATMAIWTLFTSLKIDSPVYQLCSSYDIAYNQHIRCINISFYTHALILFNSAPPAAASAASAAASAASAAASAASAAASAASAAASAVSAAAFQLELPRTMLIHNVFHLSLLWKAATDFLPGQKQTLLSSFIMNESRGMRGQQDLEFETLWMQEVTSISSEMA